MFIKCVASVWSCGIGGRRENICVFYYGNNIRSVASASTFSMISMDRAVFEGSDGRFDGTRLVKCVGVN